MGYTNQRVAYGNTLVELGRQDERIVVLDADLGASTMGKLFEAEFPQRQVWRQDWHRQGKSRLPIRLQCLQEVAPMTRYARPLQSGN